MGETEPDKGAVNKIFGTELPQEAPAPDDRESETTDSERDCWLRENVPPHHH